ncbi:MAG: class IV adenylate cyclase [Planctomycetes bacterium]|jgi:predicted adenylyl cyclase CyaB|nr:class IV adenylate cyclase [Planctomycetota bacterium]
MKRNVEIKAKVADLAAVRDRAEQLADSGPMVLRQEDTFFTCPRGRLKLRRFLDCELGELIYYERADDAGPKESHYVVHPTADAEGLRDVLSAALGVAGVVRKRRAVYLIGPTRVHLDEVEGLGAFVELEVVIQPGQDFAQGEAIARALMAKLGISADQLIDRAYVDLLRES